jgi:hypothetical protein
MKRLLPFVLVLAAAAPLSWRRSVWQVHVRVGRGLVQTHGEGVYVSYFLAVRQPDGTMPESNPTAEVSWEGIASPARVSQGTAACYAGWVYHTDYRVFPAADIKTVFTPPDGEPVEKTTRYGGDEPLLAYPSPDVDTAGGTVVVSVATVSGARSYNLRVTSGSDPWSTVVWRAAARSVPFSDTVPADSLQPGQNYWLWSVVTNIDLAAIQASPTDLSGLPGHFACVMGQGPRFTAP